MKHGLPSSKSEPNWNNNPNDIQILKIAKKNSLSECHEGWLNIV